MPTSKETPLAPHSPVAPPVLPGPGPAMLNPDLLAESGDKSSLRSPPLKDQAPPPSDQTSPVEFTRESNTTRDQLTPRDAVGAPRDQGTPREVGAYKDVSQSGRVSPNGGNSLPRRPKSPRTSPRSNESPWSHQEAAAAKALTSPLPQLGSAPPRNEAPARGSSNEAKPVKRVELTPPTVPVAAKVSAGTLQRTATGGSASQPLLPRVPSGTTCVPPPRPAPVPAPGDRTTKAIKIRLFRNGDGYCPGVPYAVSRDRYRTLTSLMEALTNSSVSNRSSLPTGVRYMFTAEGARVTSLDDLREGEDYICSSSAIFYRLPYGRSALVRVRRTLSDKTDRPPRGRGGAGCRGGASLAGAVLKPKRTKSCLRCKSAEQQSRPMSAVLRAAEEAAKLDASADVRVEEDFGAKIVTVIKNGSRPRKAVRVLLNKKSARTFNQVVNHITDVIKPDSGAVRKIFTISGKPVTCIQDFYDEERIFVACGNEKYSTDDFELSKEEQGFIGIGQPERLRQTLAVRVSAQGTVNRSPSNVAGRGAPPPRVGDPLPPPTPCDQNNKPLADLLDVTSHTRPTSHTLLIPSRSPTSERGFSRARSSSRGSEAQGRTASPNPGTDRDEPKEMRIKYKIGRVLAEGQFAIAKECIEKARKVPYTLKVLSKDKCLGRDDFIYEMSLIRRIRHANIVHLVEEFETQTMLYLVMDIASGENLLETILCASRYTERDSSGILFHLSSALHYLHSLAIVHRDVRIGNLVVHTRTDGCKFLKLGDFGLAAEVTEPLTVLCGTPAYMAPEVCSQYEYDVRVDMWAVGVVAYLLLSGTYPFSIESSGEGKDLNELFNKICRAQYHFEDVCWQSVSEQAKDLIRSLLEIDPELRLSAAEVLENPWISDAEGMAGLNLLPMVGENMAAAMSAEQEMSSSKLPAGLAVIITTAMDKAANFYQKLTQDEYMDFYDSG